MDKIHYCGVIEYSENSVNRAPHACSLMRYGAIRPSSLSLGRLVAYFPPTAMPSSCNPSGPRFPQPARSSGRGSGWPRHHTITISRILTSLYLSSSAQEFL